MLLSIVGFCRKSFDRGRRRKWRAARKIAGSELVRNFNFKSGLAELPLLKGITAGVLDAITPELEWFSLPGGKTLFEQGDRDDSLYIVLSGRLGAFVRNEEGKDTFIRHMLSGETVGEMALLSGEARSATVVAMRDSELLRLKKDGFTRLIEEHPRSLRFITDLLVRRLREPNTAGADDAIKTLAIIPLDPHKPASGFVRSLEKAFQELETTPAVVDRHSSPRPVEWFNTLEEAHGVVIYQAEFELSPWTRLCLRQADRVVLLACPSERDIRLPAHVEDLLKHTRRGHFELVVFHDGQKIAGSAEIAALLERVDGLLAHNVRSSVPRDFRRLARLLIGRAMGVVLSGGGARGFAHVGVIRALREAGLELDLFGGTSMGSIVAAGAALEWSDQELRDRMRAAFSSANPVTDYTLPLVALVRGRKVSRSFYEHFGDQRIEDCPVSFFCVSSNLSTGRLKVHRTGLMWRGLRASTSIPGMLPPVIDGPDTLIDGGVINNLPLEIMSEMRRGRIIAVNVSQDWFVKATIDDLEHRTLWELVRHARRGTPNIFTVLMAAVTLSGMRKPKALRDSVDLLIAPAMATVGMLDWKAFDTAVEAGYRSAIEVLENGWRPRGGGESGPGLVKH